jgi:hypothetical protein
MVLGLSALVSIPEALVIFMNTGGKASLKGLGQTLSALSLSKKERIGLASEQLGYTIRTAVDHSINRIGEESFEVGAWENAFIRWTGLPYLQHFLTVWAARANDAHLKELGMKLKNNELNMTERGYITAKIQESGLDAEQFMNHLGTDGAMDENSDYFKKTYIPAVVGLTHDTIVDPSPVDKPLWMNDERLLLFTQLKGFMTVFTGRVMRGWKRKVQLRPEGNMQLATKIAPYVAMYIAAQVGMQAAREFLKNGDLDDWDEQEIEERVFNAFGYLGGMGYFIDLINSMRYRSNALASAFGPAVSKGLNVVGHGVEAVEQTDPEEGIRKIIKELWPNMPGKDMALEALGVVE